MPKISVVIPFYNTGKYFDECIDSVLKQSYNDFDIIIVDDASTLEDKNILFKQLDKSDKIRIFTNEKNSGPSYSRNRAIENSDSEYILPVDSDNYLMENALERFLEEIEKRENSFVYPYIKKIGFENRIWKVPEYNLENLYYDENYIDTCAMFRRKHWELVGGYDNNIRYAEDWDLWLNMAVHGITGYLIKEVLFVYRHREKSILFNLRGKDMYRKEKRTEIRNKYKVLDTNRMRRKR
jgi:glycosyltransferase involved in cell wall biosynthesis